jgi:pseudaminic acid cytidylyltransferase
MKEEKIIAIIPARGGSKRIPRKNIKNFLGHPIIKYSIDAAINSKCFDEIMVSTDDIEIAEIAIKLGAKVPFMRSEKSSNDNASTEDVIIEVLNEYKKSSQVFSYACCIYPTAPFITPERLNTGLNLLQTSQALSLIPITRFSYPILRSLKLENGKLVLNWPEYINSRSQDLKPAYHDCGQFYFIRIKEFMDHRMLFTENTIALEIPETEVQDIDNEEDWKLAEIKYRFFKEKLNHTK